MEQGIAEMKNVPVGPERSYNGPTEVYQNNPVYKDGPNRQQVEMKQQHCQVKRMQ